MHVRERPATRVSGRSGESVVRMQPGYEQIGGKVGIFAAPDDLPVRVARHELRDGWRFLKKSGQQRGAFLVRSRWRWRRDGQTRAEQLRQVAQRGAMAEVFFDAGRISWLKK